MDEFTFGRRPSSGRTATSFSVDAIAGGGVIVICIVLVGSSLSLSLSIYVLHYGLRISFDQLYLRGNLTP